MSDRSPSASTLLPSPPLEEEIWLLGQPPLRDLLHFVRDAAANFSSGDVAALTQEWRRANDYYQQLEDTECGIADEAECRDLDPSLAPLAAEVQEHLRARGSFRGTPTRITMVELDKLIVCQKSINGTFVESLKAQFGPAPDAARLFRACLPLGTSVAPFDVRRIGAQRFVFRSHSTDFRSHEPVLLKPEQVRDYQSTGAVAGIVGLVVGFGSNLLNALEVNGRFLLHNGYHRACALRAAGLTHAPCIVQTVNRPDEIDLAANSRVAKDPVFYFRSARPPLLKDFFDPRIRKSIRVPRQIRQIEVKFEIKEYLVSE